MHGYQRQDSDQTLAEGLAEYYAQHPEIVRADDLGPEARTFFRCHDAAHVILGGGTSLPHEAAVKIFSIFGTTGGFGVLRGYRLYESKQIYQRISTGEVIMMALRAVIIVPRTLARCLRQPRRWPWDDFTALQGQPLAALRREFGIRVPESG
jgi:hypothetical protein